MKRPGKLAYVLMTIVMFFTSTAFAANKGALYVHSPTMAGDTRLPAGEYTVQWEGAGPDVELKIKLDNRVEATVPAKVIPLDHPFGYDETVLSPDGAGDRRLLEIRLSGKKFFLQIQPESTSTAFPQP
jgi:hypothetical protein